MANSRAEAYAEQLRALTEAAEALNPEARQAQSVNSACVGSFAASAPTTNPACFSYTVVN